MDLVYHLGLALPLDPVVPVSQVHQLVQVHRSLLLDQMVLEVRLYLGFLPHHLDQLVQVTLLLPVFLGYLVSLALLSRQVILLFLGALVILAIQMALQNLVLHECPVGQSHLLVLVIQLLL